MNRPVQRNIILSLIVSAALFFPKQSFAIEGKEYVPEFANPPLPLFEKVAPGDYTRQRTDELFHLLEESPDRRKNPPRWLVGMRTTYGGVGHNHFQGLLAGKRKRSSSTFFVDAENEHDFSLLETRNVVASTNYQFSDRFYFQSVADIYWADRSRSDLNALNNSSSVGTKNAHQSLALYTRELSGDHLTHTQFIVGHSGYSADRNREESTRWDNWRMGVGRGYQFFLRNDKPATLRFRITGDRLDDGEKSRLRMWNDVQFTYNTEGPGNSYLQIGAKVAAFSRYDSSLKLWIGPTFEIRKKFSDRLSGEAKFQSVQTQPIFDDFFARSIGTYTINAQKKIEDGEAQIPAWLRQQLTYRLSEHEKLILYAEEKYQTQSFFWETPADSSIPMLHFTSADRFMVVAGFSLETHFGTTVTQSLRFETEQQFHRDHIFPNIGRFKLKAEVALQFKRLTQLEVKFEHTGDFYTDSAGLLEVPGCLRVDLFFSQYLSKNFTVLVEGLNISDTNCYNEYGLNEHTRRYRIGVRVIN